jgi:HAD superfamily hydrolase (TIGR01490 family)
VTLAIFDLDNTLIAGDSDHLWGQFLCRHGLVDADSFAAQNDRFYADYQRGELDIHAYLDFVLAPLRGRRPADLAPLQEAFVEECIRDIMLPAADALLNRHRELGHRLLIITATNEFVTRPIAGALGVGTLLGCAVEIDDGVLTGRAQGTLTYREGKVRRLREWMDAEGESIDGAWFYSDSHNDLPLLEVVANPVAVDPDPTLEATARERGWPVISLR